MAVYTVTYSQEVRQTVEAVTLEDAGKFAKDYAAKNPDKALVVLTVYPGVSTRPDPRAP